MIKSLYKHIRIQTFVFKIYLYILNSYRGELLLLLFKNFGNYLKIAAIFK